MSTLLKLVYFLGGLYLWYKIFEYLFKLTYGAGVAAGKRERLGGTVHAVKFDRTSN